MKRNGNNEHTGNYYIGLDVGTNSIGWAVTDKEYAISKFKGNSMWGVRLFDEAQDASGRRSSRTARRRLERRKQRLLILEMLFADELNRVDPKFIMHLNESALWAEDKSDNCVYSLFNDQDFTDKDYHRSYPTIYHLRRELVNSNEPHDVRLVYLALHHIMKSRGHFLYADADCTGEIASLDSALVDFSTFMRNEYELSFEPKNRTEFVAHLAESMGVTAKKKQLRADACLNEGAEDAVSINSVIDMLAGATVNFADLFCDDELKKA